MTLTLRVPLSATLMLLVPAVLVLSSQASGAEGRTQNRLRNGSFERGLEGWSGHRSRLSLTRNGVDDNRAVRVSLQRPHASVEIFQQPRPVPSTQAGTVYSATAWARSAAVGERLCLRVQEWSAQQRLLDTSSRCIGLKREWQRFVPVNHVAVRSGSQLGVSLFRRGGSSGKSFEADRIVLTSWERPVLEEEVDDMLVENRGRSAPHGPKKPPPPTTTSETTTQVTTTQSTTTSATTTSATTTAPGTTTPAPAPPPPSTSRAGVGTQFHCTWGYYTDAERVTVLDRLAEAGVEWVRVDIGWSAIVGQGPYMISQWHVDLADRCVDLARARGLKVLGMLHMTPGWANGGQGATTPPTNVNDYAWAARWVAEHFRGRVAAWEVWNEPNLSDFWQGTVGQYVELLRAAYPAIKAGDPGALVLFAGVAHNDAPYIQAAYAAGAKGSFDVLATHPYQSPGDLPPETPDDGSIYRLSHLPAVRQVMRQNGDDAKPVWFTELGWSAHDNWPGIADWQRGVTLEQQGDYLVRAVRYTEANFSYVPVIILYRERAWAGDSDVHQQGYGILNGDLSARPAYTALKGFLRGR